MPSSRDRLFELPVVRGTIYSTAELPENLPRVAVRLVGLIVGRNLAMIG